MRAMRAEKFSGYEGLKLVDLPKPVALRRKSICCEWPQPASRPSSIRFFSGHFPLSKPPLVLGNEGAGVVEAGGGNRLSCWFTGDVHWTVWRLGRWRPQGETSLMADEQNSGPLLGNVMPGAQEVSS